MSILVRPAPGQLSAGLETGLPRLAIEPDWKLQQRLWGHSFHPMCSYLASFPAGLAHAFIARYSRRGDVVLDPFSGRGTTPLQACAEGRIGAGNDLNPLAHLLTAAKVDPPTVTDLAARLGALRVAWATGSRRWLELAEAAIASAGSAGVRVPPASGRGEAAPLPQEVAVCFHPATLAGVLFLRASLDAEDRTDRFLAAATVGILHGKTTSYLSDLMPNTFSMAPRYVRDFAARRAYAAAPRDVFAALDAKLRRLARQPTPDARGIALLGDARDVAGRLETALRGRSLPRSARLVITSPPYLRVVKYGAANWLRLWFMGIDSGLVDAALDDAHRPPEYLRFVREVLAGLRPVLSDDAIVVLVIGDVELDRGRRLRGGIGLAERAWEESAEPEGYRLAGIALDSIAAHRKMTKIWGDQAGRATRTDRLLVFAPTELGRARALAGARFPVDWTWPPRKRSAASREIGRGPRGTAGLRAVTSPILAGYAADVPP